MPNPTQPPSAPTAGERIFSPEAALLSYLVPGLGQIYQGRIGKGVLFLICIYGLFFYGMHLGNIPTDMKEEGGRNYAIVSNVFIPDNAHRNNPWNLPIPFANLYNRPQFIGQFWVGIAAWPAIWQYARYDPVEPNRLFGDFERYPGEQVLTKAEGKSTKETSLGWVYTVIAGVLNVMVIYDALAGPAYLGGPPAKKQETSTKNDDTAAAGR